MSKIVGINLETNNRLQYFIIDNIKLEQNKNVIVQTDRGIELGQVSTKEYTLDETKLEKPLNKIIRIATKKDYSTYKDNQIKSKDALKKCTELIKKLNLDMDIVEAYFTLNRDHLTFYFYADNRVDFRELAKELAYHYKARIDLRQIGVRDKAKRVSGLGHCGRELCCSKFLDQFDSVSISMAKNQNISLNPNKINGVCGRLLCCLKYEDGCYKECRKNLPKIGDVIETDSGNGKVISIDILQKKCKVELINGNVVEKIFK